MSQLADRMIVTELLRRGQRKKEKIRSATLRYPLAKQAPQARHLLGHADNRRFATQKQQPKQ